MTRDEQIEMVRTIQAAEFCEELVPPLRSRLLAWVDWKLVLTVLAAVVTAVGSLLLWHYVPQLASVFLGLVVLLLPWAVLAAVVAAVVAFCTVVAVVTVRWLGG